MSKGKIAGSKESEGRCRKVHRPDCQETVRDKSSGTGTPLASLAGLQQIVSNRALQRLLAQHSGGDGAFDLDDETARRINHDRTIG